MLRTRCVWLQKLFCTFAEDFTAVTLSNFADRALNQLQNRSSHCSEREDADQNQDFRKNQKTSAERISAWFGPARPTLSVVSPPLQLHSLLSPPPR